MKVEALLNLMKERRSIREFKENPVPEEDINKILEAGRWAPSSANSQPWDFIVVKDSTVKQRIYEVILKVVERMRTLRDIAFLKTFDAEYVLTAPVNIIVCGDPRFKQVTLMQGVDAQMEDFAFWGSVTLPIQNMLLVAQCLGLASVVFTDIYPDELKKILDVPDPLKVICILPVGYPAEHPEIRFRREVEEFTHRERFDITKMRSNGFIMEARKDPSKFFLKKA